MMILYYARKDCQLSLTMFFSNVVARCVVAFILVFLFSLIPNILMDEGFIRLISVTVLSCISYIVVVFFIGFSKTERTWIKQIGSVLLTKVGIKKRIL